MIVTYDEHGGCYDSYTGDLHSGSALSPDKNSVARPGQYGFTFDRFGVRVPALLISPYIAAGTIHQAPESSKYPFDHTTIIKSVKECFDLDFDFLTERDRHAPSLAGILSDSIVNPGPERIEVPTPQVGDDVVARAASAPLNDFQRSLHMAASILPEKGKIEEHLAALARGAAHLEGQIARASEDALPRIEDKVGAFLDR